MWAFILTLQIADCWWDTYLEGFSSSDRLFLQALQSLVVRFIKIMEDKCNSNESNNKSKWPLFIFFKDARYYYINYHCTMLFTVFVITLTPLKPVILTLNEWWFSIVIHQIKLLHKLQASYWVFFFMIKNDEFQHFI